MRHSRRRPAAGRTGGRRGSGRSSDSRLQPRSGSTSSNSSSRIWICSGSRWSRPRDSMRRRCARRSGIAHACFTQTFSGSSQQRIRRTYHLSTSSTQRMRCCASCCSGVWCGRDPADVVPAGKASGWVCVLVSMAGSSIMVCGCLLTLRDGNGPVRSGGARHGMYCIHVWDVLCCTVMYQGPHGKALGLVVVRRAPLRLLTWRVWRP
mmetsp:Transcript_60906/g.135706  ORF Transcript_60906/g.135706 Transcript_60906/m.135706 type:complete len:207 (-) Transcript_60906:154-774(-)